jgi:hypothetical protein
MSISMYTASAPVFVRMLNNQLAWLDKAQAHAEARQFDVNNFMGLRLAPDMLPFSKQVQISSDMVKGCMARLAGQEVPSWPDHETTVEELRARIRKTIDFVQGFSAAQIDGSDDREVVLPMRTGERRMRGEEYLNAYVLPNVYFHLTTAYALMRQAGVPLGKRDFLTGQG